ncbi:tRNA uridine 5-carboxymethylaminomethyl modification enzyme GidA [Listeria grayi FSL F6-1183]|uniref:tRNA uridine 5-carboxymethylaminomethyl modification enzyme GidA n=2 Tax=Listeria grayi TaxID=1641 RepID=A0A829R6L3_LISGR|nr:tRNA uridine 5-carboxymethylaminomethyl modification enzyme GidA [Listeria grayi FSL F6-1183]
MAGINAARKAMDKEPVILGRNEAYIGVLIDDLVTKGTEEPYRLLTSRAEYRLLLRHDNADLRLTEIGHEIGLISDERYAAFKEKQALIADEITRLKKVRIKPTKEVQTLLTEMGANELKDGVLAADFLRRPEITYPIIEQIVPRETSLSDEIKEQVEIQIKYEGYIEKASAQVDKMKRMEDKKIPENIDYDAIGGLATEALEKLKKIEPLSIAQASRISGVNPADISILLVYIEQGKIAKVAQA